MYTLYIYMCVWYVGDMCGICGWVSVVCICVCVCVVCGWLCVCGMCVWCVCGLHSMCAAAAKSHQSCPTLCDPIDGSPPGSAIPGILQARTLEWVAVSFSNT